MKFLYLTALTTVSLFLIAIPTFGQSFHPLDAPAINFQGRIEVGDIGYSGWSKFTFTIGNENMSEVYWGSWAATTCVEGIYNIILGRDTEEDLTDAVFNHQDSYYLRVGFSTDGTNFETLQPDQEIVTVPFAVNADRLDGLDSPGSAFVGLTDTQTLTNKTLGTGTTTSYFIVAPSTAPATGNSTGAFWYDLSEDVMKYYNGTSWVEISSGASIPAGLVEGQVLRWDSLTTEWIATTDLVIDDNGNVGIGTADPSATLDIVGQTDLVEITGAGGVVGRWSGDTSGGGGIFVFRNGAPVAMIGSNEVGGGLSGGGLYVNTTAVDYPGIVLGNMDTWPQTVYFGISPDSVKIGNSGGGGQSGPIRAPNLSIYSAEYDGSQQKRAWWIGQGDNYTLGGNDNANMTDAPDLVLTAGSGSGGDIVTRDPGDDHTTFKVDGSDGIMYVYGSAGIGDETPDHTLDVAGNIGLDTGYYINWGNTDGINGYGFRDNAGVINYKNQAGVWTSFTSLAGGSGTVIGTGASPQVAYWTQSSEIDGDAGMTYDAAGDRLTAVNATFTTLSAAVVDIDDGTIYGVVINDSTIGLGTAAAGAFTNLSAAVVDIDDGTIWNVEIDDSPIGLHTAAA
ncbi:MAG: hypothetical protein V1789_02515, partial [PVC group bacterium]